MINRNKYPFALLHHFWQTDYRLFTSTERARAVTVSSAMEWQEVQRGDRDILSTQQISSTEYYVENMESTAIIPISDPVEI